MLSKLVSSSKLWFRFVKRMSYVSMFIGFSEVRISMSRVWTVEIVEAGFESLWIKGSSSKFVENLSFIIDY